MVERGVEPDVPDPQDRERRPQHPQWSADAAHEYRAHEQDHCHGDDHDPGRVEREGADDVAVRGLKAPCRDSPNGLKAAVDQATAVCGGDVQSTIRTVNVANDLLIRSE